MAGRKKLDVISTTVRLSPYALERIDELIGPGRRALFIREAVENALTLAAMLKKQRDGEQ